MNPEDEAAAKFLSKLLEAGGWQGLMVASLTAAWFWFKGKNVHPEWAEKSDLVDLKDEVHDIKAEVRHVDGKVDAMSEMVHDTREDLAEIKGLLKGMSR